jgi:hypothetical protein
LHQLFFGKLVAQALVQLIGDIWWRVRKGASQFNDQAFRIVEGCPVIPGNGAQFLIAQAGFSALGRINVYSERTTDARCSADFSQLDVAQRDKSLPAKGSFHGDPAPHESR